jgi:CRISPR-associated protein Cst1
VEIGLDIDTSIRYVGDPFVDAGVAVLEHRIGKPHTEFTTADLSTQASWLESEYARKIWSGYLTLHFPNSGWCNPTMAVEKKAAFRNEALRGFSRPAITRACAYCGRPAQALANRSQIPLLTSETSMVAGPGGAPGQPVCACCRYAIQFYPLAALKVGKKGKPLFWWSADTRWLFYLTEEFLNTVAQVSAASGDSLANLSWPNTSLLNGAWRVLNRVLAAEPELRMADVVGCHTTNYGSDADYEEIRLPKDLLEFWADARNFRAYTAIVEANWKTEPQKRITPKKKAAPKKKHLNAAVTEWNRGNTFYEDLGAMLRSGADRKAALELAQKYFMRIVQPVEQGAFALARLFLERMTDMTRERLDAVERIAGKIRDSKRCQDAVDRLFDKGNVIGALVEIQARLLRDGDGPLQTADIYLAFDIVSDDDSTTRDPFFIRDLMLLKILELGGGRVIPKAVESVGQTP